MDKLTKRDLNTIAKYPLENSLDQLRGPLQVVEQSYKARSFPGDCAKETTGVDPREITTSLLIKLMGHKVAFDLPSKIGSGTVARDLVTIIEQTPEGRYDYEQYRPLSRLVVGDAADVDIWKAVFKLIRTVFDPTSTITSKAPSSISKSNPLSYDGTPVKSSSASFQDKEQTRNIIDSAMFNEIRGCTYRDVGGFFEKYFEGRLWSYKTKAIHDVKMNQHKNGRWTDFPDPPSEEAVWSWLSRFQNEYLQESASVFYRTTRTSELTGGESLRQVDILTKRRDVGTTGKHNWKDFCVIGELKESTQDLKTILKQLATLVREAFIAQPTRRFMHGFILHGIIMELWVFDRSGAYGSGEFSIHKEPEKFIRAIAGYAMMNDEELGNDTFTMPGDSSRTITIKKDSTGNDGEMKLEITAFIKQRAVVCRGTTCFRSSDRTSVAKFSWTSDKRPPEIDLLNSATRRGVEGIAKLIGYRVITSINQQRSGLQFPSNHKFRDSISTSIHDSGPPSKRIRSELPNKHHEPGDEEYCNRIYRCLVVSPAGQALSEFASKPNLWKPILSTIKELVTVLRDAIKAHRSLYLTGNILHRDISENNIIVTEAKESGNLTGMLIDLDLAKERDSGVSGARHQTGTKEFMAIEVLLGVAHTYRHDLESFFYVLIWLCARRGWGLCRNPHGRPRASVLKDWYVGTFDTIAARKEHHMGVRGLETILAEFPKAFGDLKPLCRELRGILFPLESNGMLFRGTRGEPEELYDAITEAYERALTIYSLGSY